MSSDTFESSVAAMIGMFSVDGATMVIPDGGSARPATSLQIAYLIWKNLMPNIMAERSDNEIRELAYSNNPEIRKFVADLVVLHVRQTLSTPPLEPGESLAVSAEIQKALG